MLHVIEPAVHDNKQPIDFVAVVDEGEFTSPQLVASDASSRRYAASIPAMYSSARTPGDLVNEPPAPAPEQASTPEVPSLSLNGSESEAEPLDEPRTATEEEEADDTWEQFFRFLKDVTEDTIGYNPNQIDAASTASFLDDLPQPQSPPITSVIPLHASLLVDPEEELSSETGIKRGYRCVAHSHASPVDEFSTVILRNKRMKKAL